MTKIGFGSITVGVFIYFLASQTQVGWLYLFDSIIWGLLLISFIITRYSLRTLSVERQVKLLNSGRDETQLNGPVEDDSVEIKVKVSNRGRSPRYFIKVLEDAPYDEAGRQHRIFVISQIRPKATVAFSYIATCYRRGHYKSASITLQSSDPFGLMIRRRVFQLPLNLTIYPAYYQVGGLPATETLWGDWGAAVKSSAAVEFHGSREYQYGDPLKYIHWRNTARVGQFMLKEFERASQGSVSVIFQTNHNLGSGRETTLEYSIKVAASLARLCAEYGYSIDVIAGERSLRNAGWQETMDFLAKLETGGKSVPAELSGVIGSNQMVVAIMASIEIELIRAMSRLSGRVWSTEIVLLQGFAQDEKDSEFNSLAKRSNLDIITCSRGNLEEAIAKLGNLISSVNRVI